MTAQVLWMNIPLMVLAFGSGSASRSGSCCVTRTGTRARDRSVPAYLRAARPKRPAPIRARAYDGQRGLVAM